MALAVGGDDFSLKAGPIPAYLDMKNHLIQNYFSEQLNRIDALRLIFQFFISNLFSYNYASTNAVLNAVEDVMKSPEYWIENIEMSNIRKKISEYFHVRKIHKIDLSEHVISLPENKRGIIRTLVRWLSLNGFLLPYFMFKKSKILLPKGLELFSQVLS